MRPSSLTAAKSSPKSSFESKNSQNSASRLLFLDGMRGIAILLVVLYHAYSNRWAELLPYGGQYNDIIFFRFGNYGVPLFFMISGFVIAMTLVKCSTFKEFMWRRWLRLFPAMLIASAFILVLAPLFTHRPYGQPQLQDAIPGLFFIEPEFFRAFFDPKQGILEGSFWTLFVEMKFYVLAGLLYYTIGLRKMIAVLILMYLSSVVLFAVTPYLGQPLAESLNTLYYYLNYQHYGWFAAGALLYQYYVSKEKKYWLAGFLVAIISARGLGGLLSTSMIIATVLVLIFTFSMFSPSLQKVLSNRVLVFLGFISYPLYLLHEQAMISMITQLHQAQPWIPDYALAWLPISLIVGVALLVARYMEPFVRNLIKQGANVKFLKWCDLSR